MRHTDAWRDALLTALTDHIHLGLDLKGGTHLILQVQVNGKRRGEIRVARIEAGLQIYERTEKADLNVNYFPTGNRFLLPETRRRLIALGLADLEGSEEIKPQHVAEAVGYRSLDRSVWA